MAGANPTACVREAWPLWQEFGSHFIADDGRVLATQTGDRQSFSEAQSYAMFFALVADDEVAFDKLWHWSVQNLAGGDIANRLPAWLWGRSPEGNWQVLDLNSASDADLWFAYALLEAGRLWRRPDYTRDARQLLANVERQEVVDLPGLGKMLLPAPHGFTQPDAQWRLNPSYLPLPLLRRFAVESRLGPWSEMAINTANMMASVNANGLVADWVAYRAPPGRQPGFIADPVSGQRGSYDAIRTYLWAGMTPDEDPLAAAMRKALAGMARLTTIDTSPPELIDVGSGLASGTGPYGFSAALLPYLRRAGAPAVAAQQAARARAMQAASLLAKPPPSYYDHALSLFGLGWFENRYRFTSNGQLQPKWQETCIPANSN